MSTPIEITEYKSAFDGNVAIAAKFQDAALLSASIADALLVRIVTLVAERYVQEHFIEIAEKLDQNAIANLAVADAAKKIAEEIRTSPTILHDVKTEIYQRGIFGGVRRVR